MDEQNERYAGEPELLSTRTDEYYLGRVGRDFKGHHPMEGRHRPLPDAIQMRTNDYLCLAKDPRVIDRVVQSLQTNGYGDAVSRVWVHNELGSLNHFEKRMADLTGTEDSVLCSSGYTANVGLIQSLAKPDTPVYIDMMAHLSLWEGINSANAKARPFRHNDPRHLRSLVEKYGPGYVVVDALYSTSGNVCRLEEITRIAEDFECVMIVDETHSFGCHGENGAGLVSALGLEHRVQFRTIGLSKAVASRGGVVVCSARNAEFIRYEAHPAVFSTSVLPHEVAGYDAVLDIFKSDTWRRERLHKNHAYLRKGLMELGYNLDLCESQILSLEAGDIQTTVKLRDTLEEHGIFGSIFFPPACPKNRCSIRFTVNCGLTQDQLDRVLDVAEDIREHVGLAHWRSTYRLGESVSTPRVRPDSKPVEQRIPHG